jgi:outer membrane protein TolC
LPRIDLVASYGVNGLNYAMADASKWSAMRDFPTWSVGLQISVPIGESRIGKADVTAAKLRRQDALLGLKALETQIANDVDTSFSLRSSVAERWRLWQKVLTREREQLEVERRKFAAGRSDTREVLLREERVINAQLALAEQQMAFGRADVLLQAAQGILLDAYR